MRPCVGPWAVLGVGDGGQGQGVVSMCGAVGCWCWVLSCWEGVRVKMAVFGLPARSEGRPGRWVLGVV